MQRIMTIGPRVISFGLFFLLAGCSTLRVQSDPPGARVVYSTTGLEPYLPWPPPSWRGDMEVTGGASTPMAARGGFSDTLFITVEKDGYRRPLPQTVQLYGLRSEELFFPLEELPAFRAARMAEAGFVLYQGEWVDPEEMDLVEVEGTWLPRDVALAREQRAKGMVLYNGEWMTPLEARELEATAMQARGLVELKGRWITAEDAQLEREIDEVVAAIKAGKMYPDLPAPRFMGVAEVQGASLQLHNTSPEPVWFFFSGPESFRYWVETPGVAGGAGEPIVALPGRYDIAIVPGGSEEMPAVGEPSAPGVVWASWPLAQGRAYSLVWTGVEGDVQEAVEEMDEQTDP